MSAATATVRVEHDGPVAVITIDRPQRRNAVDRTTATALEEAVRACDGDDDVAAIVLRGEGGTFCAGADLHALADGRGNRMTPDEHAPMGPTRLSPRTPTIAAVEGHAVAGGLELALWCDLRVVAAGAVFGVYCRRWGVPLIDGGTVRLPRIVGAGVAMDLILTGRSVHAEEARRIGLATTVVPDGAARDEAVALGRRLATFPQACLRADLANARAAFDRPLPDALVAEHVRGVASIPRDEGGGSLADGVARFAAGEGRGGAPAQR